MIIRETIYRSYNNYITTQEIISIVSKGRDFKTEKFFKPGDIYDKRGIPQTDKIILTWRSIR